MPSKIAKTHKQMMEILAKETKAIKTMTLGGKLQAKTVNDAVKIAKVLNDMLRLENELARRNAQEAEKALKSKPTAELEKSLLVDVLEGKNSE